MLLLYNCYVYLIWTYIIQHAIFYQKIYIFQASAYIIKALRQEWLFVQIGVLPETLNHFFQAMLELRDKILGKRDTLNFSSYPRLITNLLKTKIIMHVSQSLLNSYITVMLLLHNSKIYNIRIDTVQQYF